MYLRMFLAIKWLENALKFLGGPNASMPFEMHAFALSLFTGILSETIILLATLSQHPTTRL